MVTSESERSACESMSVGEAAGDTRRRQASRAYRQEKRGSASYQQFTSLT